MKKMQNAKDNPKISDDMRPEYHFDYSKARPNRFAGRAKDCVIVVLDPDVAEVFTTPDSVNSALRALINAVPRKAKRKRAQKARGTNR